jgi:hypothetical protein
MCSWLCTANVSSAVAQLHAGDAASEHWLAAMVWSLYCAAGSKRSSVHIRHYSGFFDSYGRHSNTGLFPVAATGLAWLSRSLEHTRQSPSTTVSFVRIEQLDVGGRTGFSLELVGLALKLPAAPSRSKFVHRNPLPSK